MSAPAMAHPMPIPAAAPGLIESELGRGFETIVPLDPLGDPEDAPGAAVVVGVPGPEDDVGDEFDVVEVIADVEADVEVLVTEGFNGVLGGAFPSPEFEMPGIVARSNVILAPVVSPMTTGRSVPDWNVRVRTLRTEGAGAFGKLIVIGVGRLIVRISAIILLISGVEPTTQE